MINVLYGFINISVILMLLYWFNIIGQIANDKFLNNKFKYTLPIGFIWFMCVFQIFSFPFILLQTTFSFFLIWWSLLCILWIVYVVINKRHVQFKLKTFNIMTILLIVFIAIIVIAQSMIFSDSWLYSTMITSTVENNLIYSNNGLQANVQLTLMHHRFDSYYLFQAVISLFFGHNYLIALVTEYKILDVFLIVFTLLEMGYQFKFDTYKSHILAFSIIVMLIAGGVFLDISPFSTTEPQVQLFQISTGTSFFHFIIIPIMISYIQIENKLSISQKRIFMYAALIFFSSISTTFYYTMPLYYVTLLIIKHLLKTEKDNVLLESLLLCFMLIFNFYIGAMTSSLVLCILFSSLYIILTLIIIRLYKIASIKFIKTITKLLIFIDVIINVLVLDTMYLGLFDFTTNKYELRIYNIVVNASNGNYLEIILPIFYLCYIATILILIIKNEKFKQFSQYILVYYALCLTPAMLLFYKFIGLQPVISRIYSFNFIGYLVIIYSVQIMNKNIVKFTMFLWTTIAGVQLIIDFPGEYAQKQRQMTAINSGIDGLNEYQFLENSFIVYDNLNASKDLEVYYAGINKLIVLNPSLSWDPQVVSCNQLTELDKEEKYEHCYTIYEKEKREDGNVNFNLDSFHKVNALYAAIFTKRYSTGDI